MAYYHDSNQTNVVIEKDEDYSNENEKFAGNRGKLLRLSMDFDETEYKNDISPLPLNEENSS